MKKLHRNKHLSCFFGVTFAILLLSGCSQKAVNDDATPSIALSMKVTEPALIEQVSQFWLIVTGPGMDSIQTELTLSGGQLEGEVDVPAGRKRKFEVQAHDQSNRLIYRGSTVVNVEAGQSIELTINLYPVVPLVKLSPRFQEVETNSPCTVDVKAFRIRDLYGIAFRIYYNGLLVYPDSAVLANDLDPNVIMLPPQNDTDLYVYATGITQTDQESPIVDENGHATLARVFFTSNREVSGTAQLTIEVTELRKPNGDYISLDSVYTDGSLIAVGCDSVVTFPDSLLEDAIRQAIPKPEGDICLSEVLTIDTLYADGASEVPGISDLTGLSHLVNLKFLELDLNQISDITELTPLTNLEMLFLAYNYQIQDITPLSGLVNLHMLDLSYNDITDIHPLIQNALDGGIGTGDVVLLVGNPLANTFQLDSLCVFGPAVFVEPDINWCE
jgi:hypothetical protein